MNDLISRQAAIEALKAIPDHNDGMVFETLSHALRDIELLPSAQRWIPVTDHNPEIDMSYPHSEQYLVTYEGGELDVARWSNVNPVWTLHVTEPKWWGAQFCKVVAWMPLPEPYRERSDS